MTDRFIIEHGVVHDIKTGRHLTQAIEDDYPQQLCDLLNEQERTIDGYREALLVLVELKRFKRQIEAGTANADMKRYYEANKEGAWLAAEAMLVGCVRTEVATPSGETPLKECPYCGSKAAHFDGCMGIGKPRFVPSIEPSAQEVINYLNECVEAQSDAWPLQQVRVSKNVVDDIIKLLCVPSPRGE